MINKCKNLEFTKRPGVNLGMVKSKGETTWCVFEHYPVLSRANVQRVINRWSQTWSEAIRYHSSPNVRVAWRIRMKPLVVRLRSNAARVIQNLRESKRDCVEFSACLNSFVLEQFFGGSMFIFPRVFHPCCFTSNLHACLRPAICVDCVGNFLFFIFSQLRMMRARTRFKISSRSVSVICSPARTHVPVVACYRCRMFELGNKLICHTCASPSNCCRCNTEA